MCELFIFPYTYKKKMSSGAGLPGYPVDSSEVGSNGAQLEGQRIKPVAEKLLNTKETHLIQVLAI